MSLFASPWIVIPGVGICTFLIIYFNAESIFEFLKNQSLGNREYVIKRLKIMFVEIDNKRITGAMLMMSFGIGALAFVAFWPNVFWGLGIGLILTIIGWRIPKLIVEVYYARRASLFVDQMVDGLTLMSNALKAGIGIPQAMKIVVDNMPDPMSQEFQYMISQNINGASIEETLTDLAIRIPYPDVQMFVTSVNILNETGGNLAITFDTIVRTIRERIKVEKKIAAVTAQGVTQGAIITMVPFVLLILFYFMDSSYIAPLFNTTLGWLMLLGMLTLQTIGGLAIRKVVKIKV